MIGFLVIPSQSFLLLDIKLMICIQALIVRCAEAEITLDSL